ncbi:hypothetical protein HMPREF0762_00061 [Slackia exigua ATCC 700122]|uniref:Uncharacterized protein n=1 Tax=Slackia exigua (strain ATCC 700122 / DSM 15923 / CIP 105133 / JCM 11022 / KCTC 5966 / S-7) TaxID=649764 RepID=D0WE37_SLAES|nr:hypothetical protein HMPREF0762_00061 [Slackia exigua ATCC 700122]
MHLPFVPARRRAHSRSLWACRASSCSASAFPLFYRLPHAHSGIGHAMHTPSVHASCTARR